MSTLRSNISEATLRGASNNCKSNINLIDLFNSIFHVFFSFKDAEIDLPTAPKRPIPRNYFHYYSTIIYLVWLLILLHFSVGQQKLTTSSSCNNSSIVIILNFKFLILYKSKTRSHDRQFRQRQRVDIFNVFDLNYMINYRSHFLCFEDASLALAPPPLYSELK